MTPPDADAAGPLNGCTVLDFSTVGPAARCARILADYGAEVVKLGPVPKDGGVVIRPPYFAYGAHRGMQRMQLDLKADSGPGTFLALAEYADVVIESFRPGVVDRLGVGYDDVAAVNPGIVYCSTSGYGQSGPRSTWAGHDINYLAVSGYLACSGPGADGTPPLPGATVADGAGGGMHAALAVLAALVGREHAGTGAYLDCSVADGMLGLMALAVDEYLATGVEPGPGHDILTGRYACYDTYACADGRFIAVGAIEPAFFANLCRLLDLERWTAHQTDDEHQDEIRAAFRDAFARRSRDEWVEDLAEADTCVAPVQTVAEVAADAQYAARGAFVTAALPGHGEFRQVGTVLAGEPAPSGSLPDPDATATDALLARAGMAAADIQRLRTEGVVA
ncbi:MAG: CaiB/BaiF CoA-transferase family protein [Acidimicrobiia bacterium]